MRLQALANLIIDITEPEDNQIKEATLFITNRISFFNAILVQSILGKDTLLVVEKKSFFKSLFSLIFKIRVIELNEISKVTKATIKHLMFVPFSENNSNNLTQLSELYGKSEISAIQGILIKKENNWVKPRKLAACFIQEKQKLTNLADLQERIDSLLTDLSCRSNYSEETLISYLIKKTRSRKIFPIKITFH